MIKIHSYKDLVVWQKSLELSVSIYEITKGITREELHGLVSQMRRASVSIPSNIAEGRMRNGNKEFMYHLGIAFASGAELETQIELAKRTGLLEGIDTTLSDSLLDEVMRMLNGLMNSLEPSA